MKQKNRRTSATPSMSSKNRQQIIIELLEEFGTGTEEGYVEKIGNSAISKTAGLLEKVHKKQIEGLNKRIKEQGETNVGLNNEVIHYQKLFQNQAKAIFDDFEKGGIGINSGTWVHLKKKWCEK